MLPRMEFPRKLSSVRKVKFPSDEGISPEILFSNKDSTCSFGRYPTEIGMLPVRIHFSMAIMIKIFSSQFLLGWNYI